MSSSQESTIYIDTKDEDVKITINRTDFKYLCGDLFNKSISLIEKVLKYSNLTKNQIDEIILTGGSTDIPKIKEIIKNFFNGKELKNDLRIPKEGIYVYGLSAIISNLGLGRMSLIKVTSLSLWIDKGDGIMEIIVTRNTKIPFIKTINLKLINNSSFICKIYEGERKLVKYNKLLGECKLDNISQKKKKMKLN